MNGSQPKPKSAQDGADELLRHLLTSELNLFEKVAPNESTWQNVAKFIAELRKGLTEMYNQSPQMRM
jgi:hypothetical protein